MVKQRFLTHFKPWLVAVIKVSGLIVGYQLFDQIRAHFQYAPLSIVDVVLAATVTLFAIGLLCIVRAWGEWCWFKLRRYRWVCRQFEGISTNRRCAQAAQISRPVTERMF
jgi:hypothetical protein